VINRHRAPASRFQRFLAGVPNTRAAAFRQSATEVGVEGLITIATSTTTATFMADFCFNGLTDLTPTDRAVTLAANRGLGWMLDTSQAKEFALAHWLTSGASGGRLFVRVFDGAGNVREDIAGDVLASITTMQWNGPAKGWNAGAPMDDANFNRRQTIRVGAAVAYAQVGVIGFDGPIDLQSLRLYGLPEAAPAVLNGTALLTGALFGSGRREFAAEVSWDLPSLAPGAASLLDVTVNGARAGDLAQASLVSSTRFIELDAAVWSNNAVRVMARNISAAMRDVAEADRALLETGLAVMGIAFLIKAAVWPLGFWLPGTYAAAAAPAAAILSILSKVGVYAVLRVWLLLFGDEGGASAGFGGTVLLAAGLLTIAFGSIAVLAAQSLPRMAGASVLVSSGTLLAAVGTGQAAVTGGALLYLASSVLALGALFLLIELVERGREVGADVLAVTREAFGSGEEEEDLREPEAVGVAIPAMVAVLGLGFIACTLLLAGLPPLSGFLAKFAIMAPLLGPAGALVPTASWVLIAALVLSGLATVVAMVRTGIDIFWASPLAVPRVSLLEIAPVGLLLALCAGLTVAAGPVMDYTLAAASALHAPSPYVEGVLGPIASRPELRP